MFISTGAWCWLLFKRKYCHSYSCDRQFTMSKFPLITAGCKRYIQIPSPYRAVNTLRLSYKNQSVNANRQIHEDLGVPLFADHIRAVTASFDSRLPDVGNPLVWQLGRYLRWPRVGPSARRASQERRGPAGRLRPALDGDQVDKTNRDGHREPEHLSGALTEVFPWFFLSCKLNARALNDAKTGHGPHPASGVEA
jgi:hypothetical protein